MKNRILVYFFLLHFSLSLGGFLGLYGWVAAAQDAATAPVATAPLATVSWIEGLVRFGLLQPLAHWVLASGAITWWTWSGLAALVGLFAVNSLLVSVVAGIGLRRWQMRRTHA
jgi:hypothetical protein